MDFYHAPGSSSQAAHIMLCEAKIDFRPHQVDIFSHTLADGSDYTRINPNGYVPALVFSDGTLLTESAAIIDWLAGKANAVPADNGLGRTRHLQMLAFMSSEIHKPFIPLFFIDDEEEKARVRATLALRFRWIAARLAGDYLFGERFSGADALLYVMIRWAKMVGVEVPDALNAFAGKAERRETVRAVLAAEGLEPICG